MDEIREYLRWYFIKLGCAILYQINTLKQQVGLIFWWRLGQDNLPDILSTYVAHKLQKLHAGGLWFNSVLRIPPQSFEKCASSEFGSFFSKIESLKRWMKSTASNVERPPQGTNERVSENSNSAQNINCHHCSSKLVCPSLNVARQPSSPFYPPKNRPQQPITDSPGEHKDRGPPTRLSRPQWVSEDKLKVEGLAIHRAII